jgi:integrase
MRPRHQTGQIRKRGSNWILRYYEDRIESGQIKRVRTTKVLAPYSEYPYKESDEKRLRRELEDKIRNILVSVNGQNGGRNANGTLTLAEFIERSYFPRLDWRLQQPAGNELHIEPSTIKGYKDIWKVHVQTSAFGSKRLRDFTARDGQQFLESLPQELSHQTHLRIKNFMRGVFTWAIVSGALDGSNPMEETKAGGQTKKSDGSKLTDREKKIQASNEHAYTLEEVAEMLDKLSEPARTVCAVAAFTGLTRSELRGLKWSDYDGETISVQRKIWNDHIGAPKTEAREAGIYVIPVLRKILTKYKVTFPPLGDGWMFRGEKLLRPLDLDNLSRREIPQHINGAWFGWHAFRRGLGTRLNEAGVDDKDIQSILRHADISTTQAYYILPNHARAQAGMKKLDKTLRTKYGIKG